MSLCPSIIKCIYITQNRNSHTHTYKYTDNNEMKEEDKKSAKQNLAIFNKQTKRGRKGECCCESPYHLATDEYAKDFYYYITIISLLSIFFFLTIINY